jgi:hypothetical protein
MVPLLWNIMKKLAYFGANSSFVTLISKALSPEGPNDFRPISLLNICLKLITKILANYLRKKILKFVYINQYGFLK